MVARDVKEDPDAGEADDEARAAVRDERKCDSGERRDPHHGCEVDQRLPADEGRDPRGKPLAERVLAGERHPEASVGKARLGRDQRRRPDEAELLSDDREDHVRVRLGQIEILPDPLAEPRAEDPARA